MTKKPVYEDRFGRTEAPVRRYHTEAGDRYGVTFTRLSRSGRRWSDSSSYGRDSLPLVAKAADRAHPSSFEQGAFDASR